jgi:hypothetical protein
LATEKDIGIPCGTGRSTAPEKSLRILKYLSTQKIASLLGKT